MLFKVWYLIFGVYGLVLLRLPQSCKLYSSVLQAQIRDQNRFLKISVVGPFDTLPGEVEWGWKRLGGFLVWLAEAGWGKIRLIEAGCCSWTKLIKADSQLRQTQQYSLISWNLRILNYPTWFNIFNIWFHKRACGACNYLQLWLPSHDIHRLNIFVNVDDHQYIYFWDR